MDMVRLIYREPKTFPDDEKFGLVSQLRRSAVSVPSNIAEGYGRNSTQDYVRFLRVAVSSLYEIQTQVEVAFSESFLAEKCYRTIASLLLEIEKMLVSLAKKINDH